MLKKLIMLFLLLVGSGSLSPAIAQAGGDVASTNAASASSTYKLGIDDRVRLTVFGEDSLSNEYPVGPNGKLSVPLVGDVQAAGRTVQEISEDIRAKLADGYLKDPNVSLVITSFRPFNILGEVAKPGSYPYRDGMTVMAAVATASGFTYRAQKKYAFIKHEGDSEETRVPLTATLPIGPGDTVRIGERYF